MVALAFLGRTKMIRLYPAARIPATAGERSSGWARSGILRRISVLSGWPPCFFNSLATFCGAALSSPIARRPDGVIVTNNLSTWEAPEKERQLQPHRTATAMIHRIQRCMIKCLQKTTMKKLSMVRKEIKEKKACVCKDTGFHRIKNPAPCYSPTGKPCSTIAAAALHFCVRYGNRCCLRAISTGKKL